MIAIAAVVQALRGVLRPMLGLRTALVIPAFAALLPTTIELTHFYLQSWVVQAGSSSTGAIRVAGLSLATPAQDRTVLLASSQPEVAKVPASVVAEFPDGYRTFPVSTGPAGAGCPTITARLGTSQARSVTIFVMPAPTSGNPSLTFDYDVLQGSVGSAVTGNVGIVQTTAMSDVTVQLSSSQPGVSVPASVKVPLALSRSGVYQGTASFEAEVTTVFNANACSVITATALGAKSRILLKVKPV